jgi:hypothetical protein
MWLSRSTAGRVFFVSATKTLVFRQDPLDRHSADCAVSTMRPLMRSRVWPTLFEACVRSGCRRRLELLQTQNASVDEALFALYDNSFDLSGATQFEVARKVIDEVKGTGYRICLPGLAKGTG